MRKALFTAVMMLLLSSAAAQSEEGFFLQVSDHCYVLHIVESGENIAVVITGHGVLLFDPPPEPDLAILVESLKAITDQPVRWMIETGYSPFRTAGVEYFARQGAVLLAGFRQSAQPVPEREPLSPPLRPRDSDRDTPGDPGDSVGSFADPAGSVRAVSDASGSKTSPAPEIIFKDDLFLYPEDLEIRINELDKEARTRADIFAYVPEEKVLFAGRLFEPFNYPNVAVISEGSVLKWIDGLQQMLDSVPLLISAIPPERHDDEKEGGQQHRGASAGEAPPAKEEKEPTLEEMVAVISSRGGVSNLQELKDTLEASKALRNGISRSIRAGRSCERYLSSSSTNPYRIYGNFSSFTEQLCRELSGENNRRE